MRACLAHATRYIRCVFRFRGGFSFVLVVLALILQLLGPSLVQAAVVSGGDWIEICSDAGAVWIRVSPEDTVRPSEETPKNCECRDCSFCLLAANAISPSAAILTGPTPDFCVRGNGVGHRILFEKKFERPMTRGPPVPFLSETYCGWASFTARIVTEGGEL